MAMRDRVRAANVPVMWNTAANAEKLKWELLATHLAKGLPATTYCRLHTPIACLSLCPWEGWGNRLQGDSDVLVLDNQ